jgi:hypothetical protein
MLEMQQQTSLCHGEKRRKRITAGRRMLVFAKNWRNPETRYDLHPTTQNIPLPRQESGTPTNGMDSPL